MLSYISIQILALINSYSYEKKHKFNNIFFYILISYIFIFCSIRLNVGGDWKVYLLTFNQSSEYHIYDLLLKKEFLFKLINFTTYFFANNIFFTNLIFATLFFFSILPFFLSQKNPGFCLFIFIPLGIFILHLGFIRQSLALSFIFLSIYLSNIKKYKLSSVFILISIGFHLSALLFIPVIFGYIFKIKISFNSLLYFTIITFFLIIVFLIYSHYNEFQFDLKFAKNFFPESRIYRLILSYIIDNESLSFGLIYRIIPTFISFLLFIILYSENRNLYHNLWETFFYILILFIFLFIVLKFYTLADRLNYFILPFQIIIFSKFFNSIKKQYFKKIFFYTIKFTYFSILLIWLMFSNFSKMNWQNYSTIF